jgi:acyl transferase domain-containing protein
MDPQQRLMLELSYEAFENAGISMEKLTNSQTGCFVAAFSHGWKEMQFHDRDSAPMYSVSGLGVDLLANRMSWFYDLRDPSVTLETACSGSLVSLCQSLRSGDCDVALAAGANLLLPPNMFTALSNQGFLSPDGLWKAFDASADGYGRLGGREEERLYQV